MSNSDILYYEESKKQSNSFDSLNSLTRRLINEEQRKLLLVNSNKYVYLKNILDDELLSNLNYLEDNFRCKILVPEDGVLDHCILSGKRWSLIFIVPTEKPEFIFEFMHKRRGFIASISCDYPHAFDLTACERDYGWISELLDVKTIRR